MISTSPKVKSTCKDYLTLFLGLVIVLVAVGAYYWLIWPNIPSFVSAMGVGSILFMDFNQHFYPAGGQILVFPEPVSGYFYSAFCALLLIPIGLSSWHSALWWWGSMQVVAFVLLCALPLLGLLKVPRKRIPLYVLLCITSLPALCNFNWGQMSVFVTLGVVVCFWAYMRGHHLSAAVVLAFVTSIKYYPVFFVLFFLVRKEYRIVVAFVAVTAAFMFLVPSVALGPLACFEFQRATAESLSDASWVTNAPTTQYFAYVVSRLLSPRLSADAVSWATSAAQLVGLAVVLVNVGVVWALRRQDPEKSTLLSMLALFFCIPFLVKTCWPHYLAYLPLCQTAVLLRLTKRPYTVDWRMASLIVLSVASIALSSIFFYQLFPNADAHGSWGPLLLSNVCLLAPLYVLVFETVRAPATSRAPSLSRPIAVDASEGAFAMADKNA